MRSFWCFSYSEWCTSGVLFSFLLICSENILISHCQMNNGRPEIQRNMTRVKKAEMMLKNMDLEANPCTDFFDFACGQWGQDAERETGNIYSPQIIIDELVAEELQSILSTIKANSDPEQKVRDFYHSCVGVRLNTPAHNDFLKSFLNEFGGLQKLQNVNNNNNQWLPLISRLRSRYGMNILIGFDIDADIATMRGNSIFLGEPKNTILTPEYCNAEGVEAIKENSKLVEKLENLIADDMENWGLLTRSNAERFAGDVLSFEFELCKIMNVEPEAPEEEDKNEEEETRNQFNEYHQRRKPINNVGQHRVKGKRNVNGMPHQNIQQLTTHFGGIINFQQYVSNIIERPFNGFVFVRSEDYLKNLSQLIKTQRETISDYVIYNALNTINILKDSDQSLRCVEIVKKYFPKIVGHMYSIFKGQTYQRVHEEVEKIFEDIKPVLDQSLDWLSEQMKHTAIQKLAQIKSRFVVYKNLDINDLSIEKKNFWQKLKTVMEYNTKKDLERLTNAEPSERLDTIEAFDANTKLMPLDNEILIGLALFQQPYYDYYYPTSMKYGVLGQYIARELSKAFDEEGWRPSSQSQRQLDAFTESRFHERSKCFRTQYSNYLTNNPDEFHTATRLREIIADSNGLNIAFNAYLNFLKNADSLSSLRSSETLSNVDFTNTQLFFIHFAQSRCHTIIGKESASIGFPLDKHTPERYDVNGPLSNFAEFAREFGCTPGDEMHPIDKCVFYSIEEN